jgi:hypothetical protein
MRRFRHPAPRGLAIAVLLLGISGNPRAFGKDAPRLPVVTWDESRSGCTFSRTGDGKYVYGLWSDEIGITVSVDSQELDKVRHRHEPFFGVLLMVRYRGQGAIDVNSENISLEFVKHFQVVQSSLDPDSFSERIQNDADELDHQTAREIEKHPAQREKKEAYMRAFQKDTAELLEFVSKNSLRTARLDRASPEVSGWVLFNAQSKWISGWKKQEEFVLLFPIAGTMYEFPFKLPPKQGEWLLRRRE